MFPLFAFSKILIVTFRPVCVSLPYRFREVISTSQESKSIGSRVIKSLCGFLSFICPSPVFYLSLHHHSSSQFFPLFLSLSLVFLTSAALLLVKTNNLLQPPLHCSRNGRRNNRSFISVLFSLSKLNRGGRRSLHLSPIQFSTASGNQSL